MPNQHHSRLDVLRVLDYVALHGVEEAVRHYQLDRRTIHRWLDRDPPGWKRDEELQRLEMAAKRVAGKVGYRDLVVGAGIAFDKAWRLALREARREAEQPAEPEPRPAWLLAVDELDDKHGRLLHEMLFTRLDELRELRETDGLPPPQEHELTDEELQRLLEWVQSIAAVPDDQVLTEMRKIRPLGNEVIYRRREGELFRYEQRRDGQTWCSWSARVGDPDQGIPWDWSDVVVIDESSAITAKPALPQLDSTPARSPDAPHAAEQASATSDFTDDRGWRRLE